MEGAVLQKAIADGYPDRIAKLDAAGIAEYHHLWTQGDGTKLSLADKAKRFPYGDGAWSDEEVCQTNPAKKQQINVVITNLSLSQNRAPGANPNTTTSSHIKPGVP